MKYRESNRDKKLRAWFANDMAHALLHRIRLHTGSLRGLNALNIKFEYPITAIAGKNGAGKSTILALACCAYHNQANGFKLPKRKHPYYTFSDFFIQHALEVPPEGLQIQYSIAHDNWVKSARVPTGVGISTQIRKKPKGGKWNDYDRRVNRTVIFLGIERIVPHAERSQSRSYSKNFKNMPESGWEQTVMEAVGYILGKNYQDFRLLRHSKYSLPIVKVDGAVYSGFNMGAGENALFEIFSAMYAAGEGSLLVLDEIELGLHAQAQRRLVETLKEACLALHTQVICTTHSKEIFDCLPNDARFFVENIAGKTRVTPEIASDFAFSKLSAIHGLELDIYVEDEVAKVLLLTALPAPIRSRITLTVIGSASALAKQLAALYVRGEKTPVVAVFDGDQKSKAGANEHHAKGMAENAKADFSAWFLKHSQYLPGTSWPEFWLLEKAATLLSPLAKQLFVDEDLLKDAIEYGLQAGKHNEFHEISQNIGLEADQCLQIFASVVCRECEGDFLPLINAISKILQDNA